jgi:hypothetical protein
MSKPANPMELVDRYLQAVRFWLPKDRHQKDLLAELGEDLHSQIEAKEEELGHPVNECDVSTILKACGNPMVVASRLGPQRHLIGPAIFPVYLFVLKMVLFWIMVPVFLFILGPINLANAGGDWGSAIGATMANLWGAGFIAAGIITLVFAMIEWTHAYAGTECKWDPAKLPPLQQPERKTSFFQMFCELAFACLGLVWLLLLPAHPFLILGPAAVFLKFGPIWYTFYLPVVLLAAASVVRSAIVLSLSHITWLPIATQLLQTSLSLLLLYFMIHAVERMQGSGVYPFLVLADSVRDSTQFVKVAAIVNVSLLISLPATWLGLSIAFVVQTWQFLKLVGSKVSLTSQFASLRVL